MEKEKILQVMEKYREYFNEWDADVAFGIKGKNIFYVLNARKEFETFMFFRTAEQLEKIILGTLAENLDLILGSGIDEVYMDFSAAEVDEKHYKSIEHYLPELTKKLDVLCKASEHWMPMMQVTFNALKNVCADLAHGEQK